MMLVPTGMMFALGYWLDGRLGTQFFAVVLFFVGVLAGFGNIYRLSQGFFGAGYHYYICKNGDIKMLRPLKHSEERAAAITLTA